MVSNLKSDERIVFFTTDAAQTDDGGWAVPVHAWVHELEPARARKALFASILSRQFSLSITPESREHFDRRVGLLCVDNQSRKRIVVELAGQRYLLPTTGGNGHTSATFRVEAERAAAHVRDGALPVRAILPEQDDRVFSGTARLIPPTGLSIISDIDDTIKITEVRNLTAMLRRTFLESFEAVEGMSNRYARWASQGAVVHFVSSSPWHLYEPLDEFMTAAGFPDRSLSLKMVRAKDRTALNLFKKGTETKPEQIAPLLRRYPQRRFVLIGDSGEQDPEVYAGLQQTWSDRIAAIFIRNADGSAPTDARYAGQVLFDDPGELRLAL